MVDSLGDRMKQYEDREAMRSGMPRLPIVIRLDGRSFHTFTRGMAKPFDHALVVINRVDVCYNGAEPIADYFVQPEEADND